MNDDSDTDSSTYESEGYDSDSDSASGFASDSASGFASDSDSDSASDSSAGSVQSYVRSRPQRGARVAFASPDLSLESSATGSEVEVFVPFGARRRPRSRVKSRTRNPPRPSYRPQPSFLEYSETRASDFPRSFLRSSSPSRRWNQLRGPDISVDPTPNARLRPQFTYEGLADDSDAETVHHIIGVRPSRSIDNRGNKEQNWLRRKVFTHQSLFNQDEKASLETYRIVQSQLIPRSEDYLHDRAILTYEGKAASSETEIRWVYV
jgi:hypothetical protein